jgi:hypothetical protein
LKVTFVPTEVALMASNETIFLSNNCSSTEWAKTYESGVFKEVIGSTVRLILLLSNN